MKRRISGQRRAEREKYQSPGAPPRSGYGCLVSSVQDATRAVGDACI